MKRLEPWFSCDSCEQVIGMGWQFPAPPEVEQYEVHFCNHHCRLTYEKEVGIKNLFYVSVDWPNREQLIAMSSEKPS